MTVELALNSAEAIRPGADQASFHVFQFVLVEFQLRFGQIDLLLQGLTATFILRACQFLLELVNPGLVSFDGSCRLDWPGQTVSCFRGWPEPDARWPAAFRN